VSIHNRDLVDIDIVEPSDKDFDEKSPELRSTKDLGELTKHLKDLRRKRTIKGAEIPDLINEC
jgi:hypothetical protein